jgi:HEAT repeat protein
MRALDKGDCISRRQAIRSLRDHADHEWATAPHKVIQSLVELLQHHLVSEAKQTVICQDVMTILGNIGPRAERAIPQLIELLQEGTPAVMQEAAAKALGKCGRNGSADPRVRSALIALWMAPNQSQTTQVSVAIALCKLRLEAKGVLRFLTSNLMASQDVALRKAAAEALAWCSKNDVDVVPALLAAVLHDKDEEVRQVAEASLAQLRLTREKAMHLCSKQLKDSCYAETALRNGGQLAVPALIEALGDEEPITRERAARTLGCLREVAVGATAALTITLRDKDLNVRLAAAKGLWNIAMNVEVIAPVLVDLLEEYEAAPSDSESRRRNLQTVMEALQRIGSPAKVAIPALTKRAKHPNRLIRESALRALKGIAPTAAHEAEMRGSGRFASRDQWPAPS